MGWMLCLAVCLLSVEPVGAQDVVPAEGVGMSTSGLQRARAVLKSAIDRGVAGSAVALIARDGKVVFHEACGDIEPGVPMTRDAIARMASIAKTTTAVAVLMLYEEGRLRLSDPVSRFIPEFAGVRVTSAGASGGDTLVAPERPVTIQDLLTHQAGLAVDGEALDKLWETAQTASEFAQGVAHIPLRSQPGTQYAYGPSYEVLGVVVERASGLSFEEFLRQRVFLPLRMTDTHFFVPENKRDRLAGVYQKDSSGRLSLYRRRGQEEVTTRFTSGGGGLRGTVGDYYRFAQMLLDGGVRDGERLISPKSIELMTTAQVPAHSAADEFGWGLGTNVRIRASSDGIGSVGSYGWNGGTGTLYLVDPRERLIVVVFVPSQPRTPGIWGQSDVRKDFAIAAYQAITVSHGGN